MVIALIHQWESGRDNSVDWDAALDAVPTEGLKPYQRRDLQLTHADHRPTMIQYDRFISLVKHFRSLNWNKELLHDQSRFKVVDPGFNAILFRSCNDLATLADALGQTEVDDSNWARANAGLAELESL